MAKDPEWAAVALHDHLASTANHISAEMGGEPLFELTARGGIRDATAGVQPKPEPPL